MRKGGLGEEERKGKEGFGVIKGEEGYSNREGVEGKKKRDKNVGGVAARESLVEGGLKQEG